MCASRVRRVIPVFDRLRHHSSVPANICYADAHNRGLEWLNGWSNAALSLTGASMTAFGLTGRAALRSDSLRWCCSREGATLRDSELDVVTRGLTKQTGPPHLSSDVGEQISGVYRQRLSLASAPFAMIDNGLGFQLVPWSPLLERELGKQVSGIAGPGSVDW